MSTSEQLPLLDGRSLKWLAIISCAVPGALLLWDALHHMLGVNGVNFAIRTTGMIGLVMMTMSLVVTPIRQLTGWNTLVSMRRNLGVYGFGYILCHFLIFFWWDRAHDLAKTFGEIIARRYLWFGFGSLLLMLPLAVTSTDGMVTRLGPKRWKRLHRLAYPAVLAGGIHYYMLVKGGNKQQPIVFLSLFAALMLYRVVRHYLDLRKEVAATKDKLVAAKTSAKGMARKKFWSGELTVARIFDETHNVKTFRLVMKDGSPLPFEAIAGQYINLMLTIDGKKVNRSYTMASSPTRSAYVEISVKRDRLASTFLHTVVKEGDAIRVGAPAGKFYFAGTEAEKVVLVAGGVGITPMMSVIRSLTDRCWRGEMYLLFAVRERRDVVFERELEHLVARHPNLHVKIVLSNDEAAQPGGLYDGAKGRLGKAHVDGFIPSLAGVRVMLCGPPPQMTAARELFVGLGVPNMDIHEEAFVSPPMAKDEGEADAKMMEPQTEAAEAAGEYTVQFKRTGKQVQLIGMTVLEAAEENEIPLPFECRSGICGQCKCKLISGRVVMDAQDALSAADKQKGLILACQARPVLDCEVDA
jgi:ferredoxin-NADP reductase/DMSO/TMAO reductase YedYZ heme-binding membrane subunit